MANNRLYVVNTETKEKACIAKNYGGEWIPGNKDLFIQILESTFEAEETSLMFVTENGAGFNKYDEYKNLANKWEDNWES